MRRRREGLREQTGGVVRVESPGRWSRIMINEQDKANPPPFKPKAFLLTKDYPHWGWKAGLTVYDCKGWDYGCANDDTRALGVEHISVTLKADGDYPFKTVPKHLLEEIQ
jgi:hypothetical protein